MKHDREPVAGRSAQVGELQRLRAVDESFVGRGRRRVVEDLGGVTRHVGRGYASRVLVRLLSAAICALGAHAVLYGTFQPADGAHAYLGWYQPTITLAAVAAVVILRPPWLRTELPVGDAARRLSIPALAILLVQESLERSLHVGHPAFVALTPSGWLVLLAGIAGTALVLALALRAGQAVVSLFRRSLPASAHVAVVRVARAFVPTLRRPLSGSVALRAPPALA